MRWQEQIRVRSRAMAWHLLLSAAVAALVAALVFGLWFPGDYRVLAGGTSLLLLIMAVDVAMGPLLTFAVYDRRKTSAHLRRDVMTIAALQLAALAYGLYTVHLARPVALVFEHDRFRVIAAAEVLEKELPEALPAYRNLPWTGPWTIAVRKTEAGAERSAALMTAILDGVDTSQRPTFWTPYAQAEQQSALQASRPLSVLIERYPDSRGEILDAVQRMSLTETSARYLPVVARSDAVAVLDAGGQVAGFIMKDGFF
jgi:uncharacterized membrane protein